MTDDASPAAKLLEWAQLTRLNDLTARLRESNPFYQAKFRAAGIDGPFASMADFAARMPFTTKEELVADQAAHPPFGSNRTDPAEKYTRFCATSGTTGDPVLITDTPGSWNWMLANWKRCLEEAGVTAADRLYFAFSFGPFLGFWTAFEAATGGPGLCIPGGGLSSYARLQAMERTGATVLLCTPTYALRLAEVAGEKGLNLERLAVRTIMVAGEPGGCLPAVRGMIRTLWHGAEVIDHHGMTEVGPVTFQRPGEPRWLRVMQERYFAEILDPETGQPVADGQVGELVLTPLGRTAWPLLRYRTRDLVRKRLDPEAPESAVGLILDGGILGRSDDMIIVRGVNIYPSALEEVVRGVPGVAEFLVHLRRDGTLDDLSLEVEPKPGIDGAGTVRTLQERLESAFSLRINVRLASEALPRYEMKAKRWLQNG
ncbi:MAG: AMP-binding protein [Verrucomicrobiota bacterium]